MRIDGVLYTFTRKRDGFEIFANGNWVGWTAGNLTDAKNTARDIARSLAARTA